MCNIIYVWCDAKGRRGKGTIDCNNTKAAVHAPMLSESFHSCYPYTIGKLTVAMLVQYCYNVKMLLQHFQCLLQWVLST